MSGKSSRAQRRRKVHLRVRSKVAGNASRPRLCVFRSARHIYAQLIDDENRRTLATLSSLKLNDKKLANGSNVGAAKEVGKAAAEKARELGFERVVFDRNGYIYHGRVKALADAAREAGLKF